MCKRFVTVFIALLWVASSTSAQSLERFSFAEPHLGTIVEITLYAPEETVANEAAKAAYARLGELDRIFSDYKSDSEVMRLCVDAGSRGPVKVSPELFQQLELSLRIAEQSDGAFDVTVGPLIKLWRRARKEKTLPTPEEIASAKASVGWQDVALDATNQTVELKRSGMQLDFGGVAKGYIAQQMSRRLREHSLNCTLVAVAGDIVAGDAPPKAAGWKVGVAPLAAKQSSPSRLLLLKNCAISTSGDAFQFVEIGGIRYSHIVDPQTGLGLTKRSSVTIVARDGAVADALATAVCVQGPEKGLSLAESSPQIEALIVEATEQGTRVIETSGFKQLEWKKE
ncbi:FAD:protein FMN transferase [Schlesneria paludicola]|uniref:FAD:protein FMN transferase n=1 Tax=Schlesneria paludicola TaxID=360056 RepID=UPI00058DDE64|nr:FAD:protein FMN transferase [Schlesneria paludicola]